MSKLKNHIIICGLGRNGQEVAIELTKQKKEFVIIEKDEKIIEEFVEDNPNALAILGDATEEETLLDAQIQHAFGLISSAATDADNVYITLTAREMNPNLRIVARALQESTVPKLKRAGATEVLLPYKIGGSKMANLITRPSLVEFISLVSGENAQSFHLEIMSCFDHHMLVGKSLKQLDIRNKTGTTIIALKKGDESIQLAPSGNRILHKDDRLFVLGNQDQLEVFKETYLKH